MRKCRRGRSRRLSSCPNPAKYVVFCVTGFMGKNWKRYVCAEHKEIFKESCYVVLPIYGPMGGPGSRLARKYERGEYDQH